MEALQKAEDSRSQLLLLVASTVAAVTAEAASCDEIRFVGSACSSCGGAVLENCCDGKVVNSREHDDNDAVVD